MIAAIVTAWSFVRAHWKLALLVAGAVALSLLRLRWTAAGEALERAAQAERNRRTKEKADAARDSAYDAADPHAELRREFGSDRR